MAKRTTIFPLAIMEKVLKNINNKFRVADSAKIEFERILREYANKLGERAIMNARHAGRVTVKKEDITLAATR